MEKRITNTVIGVIVLLFIAFSGVNSVYNLGNAEQAVIQRFGEAIKVVEEPGLQFKMPFIDTVTIYNVNDLRSIQYGYQIESDATSKEAATYTDVSDERVVLIDDGIVDIGAMVQYKIVDARSYLFNCDDQEATIRLAFETVLRRNMQPSSLEKVLKHKEEIADSIKIELQRKLNTYGLGIEVVSLRLTDVLLPAQVQEAYDNVTISEIEKEKLVLDSQRYSNEKLPKTRAEATVLVNNAKAYKEKKLAQARGDVLEFVQTYEKYKTSKEITVKRLYIEMMENVLSKTTKKYIIDLDSDDNTIKYLPLNPSELN